METHFFQSFHLPVNFLGFLSLSTFQGRSCRTFLMVSFELCKSTMFTLLYLCLCFPPLQGCQKLKWILFFDVSVPFLKKYNQWLSRCDIFLCSHVLWNEFIMSEMPFCIFFFLNHVLYLHDRIPKSN